MSSTGRPRRVSALSLVALSLLAACGSGEAGGIDTGEEGGSSGAGGSNAGPGGTTGGKAGSSGGKAGTAGTSAGGTSAGAAGDTSAGGSSGSSGGKGGASGAAGKASGGAGGASGDSGAGGDSGAAGDTSTAGGSAGAGGADCSPGTECGGTCVDTTSDAQHCGSCDKVCDATSGTAACVSGVCTITCAVGFADCDGKADNGCEVAGTCLCVPGEAASCYSGTDGTKGVGACKAGSKTCDASGTSYGPCVGEVLPQPESCATLVDDDCDGQTNEEGPDCACVPGATQDCGIPNGVKVSNVDPGDALYSATAACKVGKQTCKTDGTGFGECVGAVAPVAEDCTTAVDDNCNGQVNEAGPNSNCTCTPGETKDCYDGPAGTQNVGVCKGGKQTCKDDGSGFGACAGQVVPTKEICDGSQTDENCDGKVNEPGSDPSCVCAAGTQKACYDGPAGTAGVGLCKTGLQTCKADGTGYGACEGQVVPAAETCKAGVLEDENCDGQVNEGGAGCACAPGGVAQCYDHGLNSPELKAPSGLCIAGFQLCKDDGTGYGACTGQVLPQAEVCDEPGVDEDCDGSVNEGGAGCDCVPGQTDSCWTGPAGVKFGGTSVCQQGTKTCQASGKWGACQGQVLPQIESADVCTPNVDEDCDGDPLGLAGKDQDNDGWTVCQGDCCDTTAGCTSPKLVNPGAFDVGGNNLDDDCDGTKDNAVTECDSGLASNSGNALDYARAIDLCQTTIENPVTPQQKKWGVISAQLVLADGTSAPNPSARSIRPGFGSIGTRKGNNLAVLSTGSAADANDANPGYTPFQQGQDMGTESGFPADWLAANGNKLPNAPGCPGIAGGNTANDPAMLKVRVRVPTNAQSFSFNSFFLSAEYPEWVCSPYNDFFVALLDSDFKGTPANPTDKNLAFYKAPNNSIYPVGVNLAYLNNGLFQVCQNGTMACSGDSPNGSSGKTISTCNLGNSLLQGTGFDLTAPANYCYYDPYPYISCTLERCKSGDQIGGGTGYLTSSGNVKPGEVIEVRFAVWDTSDHAYDSVLLLDNWTWSLNAAQPGTVVSN